MTPRNVYIFHVKKKVMVLVGNIKSSLLSLYLMLFLLNHACDSMCRFNVLRNLAS